MKKRKRLKKDTPGMHFEAYANRMMSLNDFTSQKVKKIQQNRFQTKNIEMRIQSIRKSQFSGLNDKRFYFYDGIVSMPYFSSSAWKVKKRRKERNIFLCT